MELLLPQLFFVIYIVVIMAAAIGVAHVIYRDATYREVPGSYPLYWAVGSIVIPFIIIPLYVYYAPALGERTEPLTRRERWAVWLYGSVLASIVLGTLISPPDPISQILVQSGLFVLIALLCYFLIFREYHTVFFAHGWSR